MKDSPHQAWLADCLGEPTGRESQAGRAGLEGTHSTNTQQDSTQNNTTTQQLKKHNKRDKITRK